MQHSQAQEPQVQHHRKNGFKEDECTSKVKFKSTTHKHEQRKKKKEAEKKRIDRRNEIYVEAIADRENYREVDVKWLELV